MAIDKDKRRARWKRNKSTQRARQKSSGPSPNPINAELAALIWNERTKRLRNFPWYLQPLPNRRYYPRNLSESSHPFVCDVWAVLTLLKYQYPGVQISAGKIAECLELNGCTAGFTMGSVRTKVWRARRVIKYLEDAPAREGDGRYWPKFPQSVADHGSGVIQHVEYVFRFLKHLDLALGQNSDRKSRER